MALDQNFSNPEASVVPQKVTGRAVFAGLVLALVAIVWNTYVEYIAHTGRLNITHFPIALFVPYVVICLCNGLLRRREIPWAFTSTEIDAAGLVKEVKHYEPAFSAVSNAVSGSTTVTFPTAINSSISANDEVFGTNLSTNPTVSSIAEDKQSIVVSSAVTIDANTTLKFVGSVDANDTFVIAETVSFYDDGAGSTFTEDKVTDAS